MFTMMRTQNQPLKKHLREMKKTHIKKKNKIFIYSLIYLDHRCEPE